MSGPGNDPAELLAGKRVYLRPVTPADYPLLRAAELSPGMHVLYRHRGTTPTAEEFAARQFAASTSHLLLAARSDHRVLGSAELMSCDFRNGHGQLAVYLIEPYQALAWPLEGFKLFIDFVFHTFPLRKLYGVSLAPNLERLQRMLGGAAELEGLLKAHEYYNGSYVDQGILAIYRDQWFNDSDSVVNFQRSRLASRLDQLRGAT